MWHRGYTEKEANEEEIEMEAGKDAAKL